MIRLPPAPMGAAIGLLGGSFDPAHEGHVHITLEALKRFGLDRVWWLVSPGNPLKAQGPAPLARRMTAARAVMRHPSVAISGVEADLGTRHTAETLMALRERLPGRRLVWLMGADNLATFHHWDNWTRIMETVPVGVLARPGQRMSARRSPAAARYATARLPATAAALLPDCRAPAWCFVNVPLRDVSSSAIRARGDWG